MGVLQLLAQDNFIAYNKVVAKKIGVNSAILIGALCSYQNSFKNQEFFKEQDKISEDTCLSEHEIRQATKILSNEGILKVVKKGLPARNYYFIVEDKLFKILSTGDEEFKQQEPEKIDDLNITNNSIIKNSITKNSNNIYIGEFDELWQLYPRKKGKPNALKAYIKARKNGTSFAEVKQGIENYCKQIEVKGTATEYIKHGSTWFNQEAWCDEYDLTPTRNNGTNGRNNQEGTLDFAQRMYEKYKAQEELEEQKNET